MVLWHIAHITFPDVEYIHRENSQYYTVVQCNSSHLPLKLYQFLNAEPRYHRFRGCSSFQLANCLRFYGLKFHSGSCALLRSKRYRLNSAVILSSVQACGRQNNCTTARLEGHWKAAVIANRVSIVTLRSPSTAMTFFS